MQSFEYANPTTVQEAVGLLGTKWGQTDVLAGGTDLISLMKDHLHEPKRVVNIKNIKELEGVSKTADGLRIGALVTMDELAKNADVKASFKSLSDAAAGIPSPQIRHMGTAGGGLCPRPPRRGFRAGGGVFVVDGGRRSLPASPVLVLPAGNGPFRDEGRQVARSARRKQIPCDLRRGTGVLRQSVQPGTGASGAKCAGEAGFGQGDARGPGGEVLRSSEGRDRARNRFAAERDPHGDHRAERDRKDFDVRAAAERG